MANADSPLTQTGGLIVSLKSTSSTGGRMPWSLEDEIAHQKDIEKLRMAQKRHLDNIGTIILIWMVSTWVVVGLAFLGAI